MPPAAGPDPFQEVDDFLSQVDRSSTVAENGKRHGLQRDDDERDGGSGGGTSTLSSRAKKRARVDEDD